VLFLQQGLFGLPAVTGQEFQPVTLRELTQRSEKIVTAEVVDQYSAWDPLGREIYTYTTLRVERVIKSQRRDSVLVLRHLGGRVGNVESHVPGLPHFEKAERVLVFLGPYPGTQYFGLIDWREGKYVITRRKPGGPGKAEEILQGLGPGHGQRLEQFVATLRRYL